VTDQLQLQLPGYCWRCADRRVLVVVVRVLDRHGDRVPVEKLEACPDCSGSELGADGGWR
jgi:hypothetical protein